MEELPIPDGAREAELAVELLRVWATEGDQHFILETGVWKDPANWGILLVDLARHLSIAYEEEGAGTYDENLERIRAAFDAEWSSPTE